MLIFGIILVALSLIALGWFIGVEIDRYIHSPKTIKLVKCHVCEGSGKLNKIFNRFTIRCWRCDGTGKIMLISKEKL